MNFENTNYYDSSRGKSYDKGLRAYMLRVYQYVAMGLLITGLSSYLIFNSPISGLVFNTDSYGVVYGFTLLGMLLTFCPLFIGLYFFWGFGSMSLEKAKTLYWIYAGTVGVSVASLGFIYTGLSLAKTFFITSSAFGGMSLYGYKTDKDLTSMASFLMMGLIGLLIASIINIFVGSSVIYFMTSFIGVIVFMGLIAWNTQKIKRVYYSVGGGEFAQKYALMSAFELYLDFINLFFYLVRFFGDRKN